MKLRHTQIWFSGVGTYEVEMSKDANILDVSLDAQHLTISFICKDPFLHLKKRLFVALPTWKTDADLDKDYEGEMAYLGIAHWPTYPQPSQSLLISVKDKNTTYGTEEHHAEIPVFQNGEVNQMGFEQYLIFEEVKSEDK